MVSAHPTIRPVTAADAQGLARLHALCFEDHWDEAAFAALIEGGALAWRAQSEGTEGIEGQGLILIRDLGGEAEILTLGVVPHARRRGIAKALIETALANRPKIVRVFLEVAADNAPAQLLYAGFGFVPVGRRPGYYARPSGRPVDALVLRLTRDA